jgi:hypothetical protein
LDVESMCPPASGSPSEATAPAPNDED